jgi:hypothetical protein
MNETRSTHRRGRISGRLAVVLCLALFIGLLPMAAFAVPSTVTDARSMYINSATINLTPARAYTLDGGWTIGAAPSVTTSVYGPHVLRVFAPWKSYSLGTTQTVTEIPFFVDEDVRPVVTSNAATSYVTTATITISATDNFNGSGVDSLYYRIDGGNIVQVVAPAGAAATKALIASLPKVQGMAAPPLSTYDQDPPHADWGACLNCHELSGPTPEPTGTPVPGTRTFSLTALGAHTVEYWANDVARNESVHVTKSFTIVAPTPPAVVRLPTTTTLKCSAKTIRHGSYVTLTAQLLGGSDYTDEYLNFEVIGSGLLHYKVYKTVKVSSTGVAVYRYKISSAGTRYHRVRFLGSAKYLPAPLQAGVKLVSR